MTGSVTKGSAEHSTGGQIINSNNKGGPDTFVVQKNTQGKYGRFTIDASGNWVYQLENDYPTTVALTEEATDSFRVYRLSRVYGQTVPREGVNSQRAEYLEYQVEVTILPGSPPSGIWGTLREFVTEDAPPGRGGKADGILGVHNDNTATFSKEGPGPIYGWFRLYNDGGTWRWTYTLDNSRAVTNRLNVGAKRGATETIEIRASNGATANIVITISGSDDPAVIGGTLAGTVTEDATEDRSTPFDLGCRPFNENDGTPLGNCVGRGTSTGSGTETKKVVVDTVRGEIIISDDDRSTLKEETIEGRYGTLRTSATPPRWEYTLDNDRPRTNALDAGQREVDDFAITVVTPNGNATAAVNITVVGSDDRSGIIGDLAGAVIERGTPAESRATGRVTIEDLDATPATLVPQDTAGTYGRFQALADGNWTYDIDNSLPATADLGAGETVRDIFPIATSDGGKARVIITVAGAEGKGIIGGDLRGIATELVVEIGGRATTTGGAFTREVNVNTTYGSFSIFSDGRWFYRLGDGGQEQATKAAEALRNKDTVTDSFLIRNQGGDTARVTINIVGSDTPRIVSGDLVGTVTEDDPAASRATGRATATAVTNFKEQTDVSGTYGTFTIEGNGDWTYELDNRDPNVNALGEGQTQTDSFVIRASDRTTGTVTITIIGADDVSTIGGALEGYVIATRNDPTKSPRVTGVVSVSDPDTRPSPTVVAQTDVSGTYGTFTIAPDGSWAYDLDNSHPDIAALRFEQRVTDPFPISTSDGTSGTVTITIAGASSPSTLSGTMTGTVTEGDGPAPSARGRVREAAAGSAEKPIESGISFASQDYTQGTYGRFSLESDGTWLYVLDNSDPDTVALTEGQTGTDSFAVKIAEGKDVRVNYFCTLPPPNTLPERGCFAEGQDAQEEAFIVTITITGTDVGQEVNTPAVFDASTLTGAITEDTATTSGTVQVTDADGDDNKFTAAGSSNPISGSYGSLTITEDGDWTYSLDNSLAAVQALGQGATLNDNLTIQAADGTAGTLVITITGVNDAAMIGGTVHGSVTEDATNNRVRAFIRVTDVDGDNTLQAETVTRTYGDFVVEAIGFWTYTLVNSRAATNALSEGQRVTDQHRVRASDGTLGPTITITITGADDQATIGGNLTGAVTEDAPQTMATGTVTLSDVDGGSSLTAQTDTEGKYGTFSLNATSGAWTYSLDNNDPDTNALQSEQTVNDETFDIAASDGASATVTISITGADDPTSIEGDLAGSVTEDATQTMATGTVTSSVDGATFTAQTDVEGKYGTFSLATSGVWTYSLDNSDTDTNALADGVEVTDSFTIAASDGSTASVVITVTGANDAAVFDASTLTGAITEDTATTSGTVQVTDVDGEDNKFTAVTAPASVSGSYGSLTITEDGAWTYTLNNSLATVQALGQGAELNDSLTIQAADRTAGTLVITITGADDQATIGGDLAGSVTEDATETMATGTVTLSDVDGGSSFTEQTDVDGTYGTFSLATSGAWTYSLDNSDTDTNALRSDQTVKETFDIAASDGARATVTISITGADDPTSIEGDLAGSVTEDATETMATGTVTSSVVGATFTAQTDVEGKYGTFSLTEEGGWTYSLDNSDTDTNALADGVEVTDSFTIVASDDSTASVVITITGANDAARITGTLEGFAMEDGTLTASGTAQATDVDGEDSFSTEVAPNDGTMLTTGTGTYGSLTITEDGAWTYTLTNSGDNAQARATQALPGGETATDTFTIQAKDGTQGTITITVTGADDQGTIEGNVSGSVREAAGDEDDPQDTASGSVRVTGDTDAEFTVQTNKATTYGTFNIDIRGDWTYRLDKDKAAALRQGETAEDTITIEATSNGTRKTATVTITVTGSGEGAAAPVTRTDAVTGYLQGRAEVLLGKQPELGGFLKNLRSGITSEGQVSVDVRDGELMGFDGSFVRDGLWGALSVARSEQGSGKTDQIFGTLGYHGQVADATLVGLMLQFDQADGKLDAGLGSIDGQGLLFGPYFAAQYQAQPQVSPLTLEGRLLYGPTSNDVRFVDGGTGAFDTQRWLASFRLEGEVLLDYDDRAIRFIPYFDYGWVQDKVEAFTDSAGMQVAGQTVRFSEVALGSDIEVPVRFGQRDAMITGGLSLVSTREQSQGRNARVSVSDTHGRLELGLGYRLANGIELEFGGSYDDVEGTDSEDKFSLSFGLSNQF